MCENNDLVERLLECEEDLKKRENELKTWTDSLQELSEIEDSFPPVGKTILDIGTA